MNFSDDEGSIGFGGGGGGGDDDGSIGFDEPDLLSATDSSSAKPSLKEPSWDDDMDEVLEEVTPKKKGDKKKGDKKKGDKKPKKTYQTSKEDMMSAFGFNQGSCDFCLKFVNDDTIGLLQKCMCNKKYFCTDCLKQNKLVAEHQQECAMERFQKRQQKLERKVQ